MLCNHAKPSHCLLLLTALLVGLLAACGGDEPARPPPPAPPPRPVFVPKDVPIDLGTSGEQVTLQTTESGGYTRNGEAFASGTTVEAGGNTYRLTLADGEWKAEYVPPRPWATALGTSGDALLITRREDGLYEAGDEVFSSGGTVTAANGNQYRLTLNADTNAWQVEYLPPEPVAVLLGMSGETVLVERLEGGGYSVGGQRVVDGSTVRSASGSAFRLSMQDGTWTATFMPPPPVIVSLGSSGQTVTLQIGEDGHYQRDGQPFASGATVNAPNGSQYVLTLADGQWTAEFVAPMPNVVSLGRSGQTVTLQRREDGQYYRDGQLLMSGATVDAPNGNQYVLTLADGQWTADFAVPPPEIVQLPGSGQTVTLQRREDGQYYRGGQLFASGTEVDIGGETFRLTLQNGQWTAVSQAPVLQMVTLGTSDVTLTLQRSPDGIWTLDGEQVRNGEVQRVGDNRYRLLLEDGEWSAEFLRDTIPVEGAGGLIVLFREEDGTLTYNGRTVGDGSVITQDGRTYELLQLSDGWLAVPGTPPPAEGDQNVSLPNGQTVTLRRTSAGTYTYNGNPVSDGSQITVGEDRYVLTQASDDTWSARAVRDTGTVDTGGVAGPTQTDTVDDFTDGRFDDDLTADTDLNRYGVQFSTRGQQPDDADDRGTKIVPQRSGAMHVEFPVYELMQQELVTQERTYVDVAKAKLQEIVDIIRLNKDLYARDARDPDDHIADDVSNTAASGIGLWRQAEMAVGMIFGLTGTTANDMDGILGGDPWRGLTLDFDEVDDVIEALEDTIATLSDVGRFGREYEDRIAAINGGPDGVVGSGDDDLDPKLDAVDFFNGLMTRIRFGSTSGTRFGAYVVKQENVSGTPSDAARGGWTKGVFAYTPSDAPSATDIPDRGEARFDGSTVAVSALDLNNKKGATLYAGKIELVASFTRKNVKGTITELKDESGRTWEEMSDEGRDKAVDSILLPDARISTTETERGFYESDSEMNATAVFKDSLTANKADSTAVFRVQFIEDAGEAFGVWTAFNLEGAFGATKTRDVTTSLPADVDTTRNLAVPATVHYITNTTNTAADGGYGPITPFIESGKESTFSLTKTELGLGAAVTEDEMETHFEGWKLRSIPSTRSTSSTFVSALRSEINNLKDRRTLTNANASERLSTAGSAASSHLGFDLDNVDGTDEASLGPQLDKVSTALLSFNNFERAQASGEVFEDQDWSIDQLRKLFGEKRWDFKSRSRWDRYTRFGVWSQIAPMQADNNLGETPTDLPRTGSFAYSPLKPVVAADISSLNFVADYEGKTLAVQHTTGDLYEGDIRLVVSWGTSPTVKSTITNLRAGSRYFKHGTQDVQYIFFNGITATYGQLGGTLTMSVRYRNSSRDESVTNVPTIDGVFVKDAVFTDEPVGVLGTWSIPSGNGIDAFSASFGAELEP